MGTFWQSVRTAYSGWWTLLGLVAASISGFNLLHKLLSLGLSEAIAAVIDAYKNIIHLPAFAILEALGIPAPPDWAIDLCVLWILVAGIVMRTAWAIRAATIKDGVRMGGRSKFWSALMQNRFTLPIFLAVTIVAWPYVVWMLLSAPHVIRYKRSRSFAPRDSQELPRGSEYFCDMRIVLATHATTAVVCILCWAIANVLLA